ncbi:hypothetical protein GBA52_015462 [Prunus armeniaca]|nr:hypothetical protein GBA52_015462 [Prunus armeniaca]
MGFGWIYTIPITKIGLQAGLLHSSLGSGIDGFHISLRHGPRRERSYQSERPSEHLSQTRSIPPSLNLVSQHLQPIILKESMGCPSLRLLFSSPPSFFRGEAHLRVPQPRQLSAAAVSAFNSVICSLSDCP